jgi:DNA-binding MarR family transcriptional regulator
MWPADPIVETLQRWIEVFMRRSMHGFIRYSKNSGLSMPQIGALMRIQKDACGVSDLGDHLGVSNAAASQMLDRMVQQGLIDRTEDPQDRRAKQLVLTDKGRLTIKESVAAREGWLQELSSTLSADEKELVTSALKVLIEKASQLEGPSRPD